jgi:hypothetical protein
MAFALARLAVALLVPQALRHAPPLRARTGKTPLGTAAVTGPGFGNVPFGTAPFGGTTGSPEPLLPLIVSRSGLHSPVHRRLL